MTSYRIGAALMFLIPLAGCAGDKSASTGGAFQQAPNPGSDSGSNGTQTAAPPSAGATSAGAPLTPSH
jgi:hypothetical protein